MRHFFTLTRGAARRFAPLSCRAKGGLPRAHPSLPWEARSFSLEIGRPTIHFPPHGVTNLYTVPSLFLYVVALVFPYTCFPICLSEFLLLHLSLLHVLYRILPARFALSHLTFR